MYQLGVLLPIVHVLFFILLGAGWYLGRLSWRGPAVFVAIWLTGFLVRLHYLPGPLLFYALVAVLDVILVLRVFGHDINI